MSRHDQFPPAGWTPRRPSALSTLFKSVAAVAITVVLCASGVASYVISRFDSRAGDLIAVAGQALESLPATLQDAAPILADATKDRRDPAYARSLVIEATVVERGEEDRTETTGRHSRVRRLPTRGMVEIENQGDQVVSILALRVVSLDDQSRPLKDWTVYGATPLALEDEWRGPLFPGHKRRIPVYTTASAASLEVEIAELRVWDPSVEHGDRVAARH